MLAGTGPARPAVDLALDVPYVPQTEALCGGAAAAMVLRYWGDAHAGVQEFASIVDARAVGVSLEGGAGGDYPYGHDQYWRRVRVARHMREVVRDRSCRGAAPWHRQRRCNFRWRAAAVPGVARAAPRARRRAVRAAPVERC